MSELSEQSKNVMAGWAKLVEDGIAGQPKDGSMVSAQNLLANEDPLGYWGFMEGDWDKRHSTPEARAIYGVWRWRGMYEYREVLVPEFEAANFVIDYGGALGPLGLGAVIVDQEEYDVWGNPTYSLANLRSIPMIHEGNQAGADIVFTSHTLEHVEDYEGTLRMLVDAVAPGGLFIAHVPHVSSEWWWPENKEGHLRTFGCSAYHDGREGMRFLCDDVDRDDNFDIEINRRCGDGSMLVVARKL